MDAKLSAFSGTAHVYTRHVEAASECIATLRSGSTTVEIGSTRLNPHCLVCRSFDQFANLIMEQSVERIVVGSLYAERALGLYVVRGENVVLLGEIDEMRDPPAALRRVSEEEIKVALKAEKEQEQMKADMKHRMDFLDFE